MQLTYSLLVLLSDFVAPPCDNVESCVGGVCTCEKNYLPPDCCDCEKDLYKAPDGTCLSRWYISDLFNLMIQYFHSTMYEQYRFLYQRSVHM